MKIINEISILNRLKHVGLISTGGFKLTVCQTQTPTLACDVVKEDFGP
jgi:hypothetical protein